MALRPGRTMRKKEKPYTRVSKKKPRKSYVVGVPYPRIHLFEMGDKKGEFELALHLVSKQTVQIRDNALEAARIVAHKFLEKRLGKNYFFKILVYPHHVIREHAIARGAGADRFSQGMRRSFGKPVGTAAQVRSGQRIMTVKLNRMGLRAGKEALKRAGSKIPSSTRIEIED